MSGLKRIVNSRRRAAQDVPHPPESREPPSEPKRSALARLKSARREQGSPAAAQRPPAPQNHQLDIVTAPKIPPSSEPPLESTQSSPSPRLPEPPTSFHMAKAPAARHVSLSTLLAKSSHVATVKKADAERHSLVTAIQNDRDLHVLLGLLEKYLPYALTCYDISQHLKAKGIHIGRGISWGSGLTQLTNREHVFDSGLGLEAAMVLMFLAVGKIRILLEAGAHFALQDEQTLVSQIKSMQNTAGIFVYVRDTIGPKAIADFVGDPPPELCPQVATMFVSLSLCIAQTLHVRRAASSTMSPPLLTKLSVSAADYAQRALATFDTSIQQGILLNSDLKIAAAHLHTLSEGWAYHYHGSATPLDQDAGRRVSSLRAALSSLDTASKSTLVGKVAALNLENLRKELDDAVGENNVVYQHALPALEDLNLPLGRSLANPTPFAAIRILPQKGPP